MKSQIDQDLVQSIYVDCKLVLFDALNLIYLQLIQTRAFVPSTGIHSVSATVQEIIDLVMWKKRSREIQIDVKDSTTKGCILSFDQRSLQVVLLNVITNALKFQEKGRIFIVIEDLIQSRSLHTML